MRKIKQWGKIRLWETSCCGIPMYPAAHKSYSLIKALTETEVSQEPSEQLLNKEENQMPEEKKEGEEKPEESEEPKEAPEAQKAPEEPEEPKVASVDAEKMTGILTKAIVDAIQKAEVKRGLTPEQNVESMEAVLKTKSLGELALMQGLFKTERGIGEPQISAEW